MANMSIGILNPDYFIGRKQLLDWVNNTFSLSYSKVEDCGTGALYCQILDKTFYPQATVPMSKVNFAAKLEYENVENFKLLQRALDNIAKERGLTPKSVPVEALVRCKYQDNIEFLQWMHSFHDANCAHGPYDAVERRSRSKGGRAPDAAATTAPKARAVLAPAPGRSAAAAAATTTRTRPTATTTAAAAATRAAAPRAATTRTRVTPAAAAPAAASTARAQPSRPTAAAAVATRTRPATAVAAKPAAAAAAAAHKPAAARARAPAPAPAPPSGPAVLPRASTLSPLPILAPPTAAAAAAAAAAAGEPPLSPRSARAVAVAEAKARELEGLEREVLGEVEYYQGKIDEVEEYLGQHGMGKGAQEQGDSVLLWRVRASLDATAADAVVLQ